MLVAHGVKRLADVRRFPHSRRLAWANEKRLKAYLLRRGIRYGHLPELGGRRKARPDSPNAAWRSAGFRGYADHMDSKEFARGWKRLQAYAKARPTAVMCAEAMPWRCHRGLLADYALANGWEVRDIMSRTSARLHRLTSFAVVRRRRLRYPAASSLPRVVSGKRRKNKMISRRRPPWSGHRSKVRFPVGARLR